MHLLLKNSSLIAKGPPSNEGLCVSILMSMAVSNDSEFDVATSESGCQIRYNKSAYQGVLIVGET